MRLRSVVVVSQVAEVDDVPIPLGALPRLRGALLRRQDGHKLEVAVVVGRGRGRRDRRRRRGRRGRRRHGGRRGRRYGRGVVVEAAVVVEEGRKRANDGMLVVGRSIEETARNGADGATLLLRVCCFEHEIARCAELEFAVARLLPVE